MVGIVIVSHGAMANGMLDAARMIVGEQEGMLAVSLEEMEDVEGLIEKIAAAVEKVDTGDGVLVLVDVFGASPFNASARLTLTRDKMDVITGMNLPMLLELAIHRQGSSLDELVKIALEAGPSSIKTLSETLKSK
ncbi:MAG: PTS sugar transporter subunit IIA [Anaerolineaceae bacterium]